MKRFLTIISCLAFFNMTSQNEPISAFLEKWNNSKAYLIDIAKAMPEEAYSFKPTEREMTFAQQLLHIKENMDWLSTSYFSLEKYQNSKDINVYTKAEIIAMLAISFNNVALKVSKASKKDLSKKVDFFAGPKTKLQILNLLQDHVTHHRGQIIVYLNLKDVAPPKYVGW